MPVVGAIYYILNEHTVGLLYVSPKLSLCNISLFILSV